MMIRTLCMAVVVVGLAAVFTRSSPKSPDKETHGGFTGEVKLVFYVKDVRNSVKFYTGALGFRFHHFYDHVSGNSVATWVRDTPPIYAEMSYAGRRFGIHSPTSEADGRSVGAAKVYFRVEDLDAHHRRATAWEARPSAIKKRSWMDMFHVVDADGNRIFFALTDDNVHGNPWRG